MNDKAKQANAESKEPEVLFVGIDLGTSHSAISTSDGQRHVIDSYVGWPRDMVASKVLKKKVLVGVEALDSRTMVDLHRPLERGLIKEGSEKDAAAVGELLKHLLTVAGVKKHRKKGTPIRAVVGVPAEALRSNKQQLRNALKGLVDSVMIVSEPFAVAYGLEALLHSMIIDLGAGTTDFCVMEGRYPTEEDQRTLTQAGDSVDEQLQKLVATRHPEALFSIHMVRDWKEKHSFVGDPAAKVMVQAPINGRPTDLDITAEMKAACESLLDPVVETMLDLIAKVEPEYQEKVRKNIILSGGTALIDGLPSAVQAGLSEVGGGKVRLVEDTVYVGSDGGLALALDAPEKDWEKLSA